MLKVLVVGGAGYIGSVLCHELLEHGYEVRVLDRLYFGDHGLRGIHDRIELVVGDMRTADETLFMGIGAVINVGGLSNDPQAEYNPQANHEMNTVAAKKLADLCVANGVPRYIYASSCSIYDRSTDDNALDVLCDENLSVSPQAMYAISKKQAESMLARMASDTFCPIVLRKGTVYGFSPRMRYDLVVNTFVKDALLHGRLVLNSGGEMWRPLIDVHDVARAYITCLEVPADMVRGEIFNVASENVRISELALRVQVALNDMGLYPDIKPDYDTVKQQRSYRVSTEKFRRVVNFSPQVTIEASVKDLVRQIDRNGYTDFDNPRYYNIRWMQLLEEAHKIASITGSIF